MPVEYPGNTHLLKVSDTDIRQCIKTIKTERNH